MISLRFLRHSVLGAVALAMGASLAQAQDLAGIKLSYTCGNNFRIRNTTAAQLNLTYTVYRTGETGTVAIPAKPDAYPYSETYFVTSTRGAVELSYNGHRVAQKPNGGLACPAVASTGYITQPTPWKNATAPNGIVAIHAALLPNGKVLSFGRMEVSPTEWPQLWDPKADSMAAQNQTQYPIPRNQFPGPANWNQGLSDMFCSGHDLLADGRLLVVGGHDSASTANYGLNLAFTFDYRTNTWTQMPNMLYARWYPTVMTLPDGEALINGGQNTDSVSADSAITVYDSIPEIFNPTTNTWRQLTTAKDKAGYYPWMFVTPSGSVFEAGEPVQTRFLNISGTGSWSPITNRVLNVPRDYGSAIEYDAGKIMVVGGGHTQATAELIDLTAPTPTWSLTAPMVYQRRQMSAVIMADGKILVSGGSAGANAIPTPGNGGTIAYVMESWDPATQLWSELASIHVERLYHSNNLLLPDGRVIVLGSGEPPGTGVRNETSAEFFYPPYLYNPDGTPVTASRPIIITAPTNVTYGQTFQVQTQNVVASKVLWVRLGAVTHAYNAGQRASYLSFTQTGGTVWATAPANSNLATPGFYLLFVLNARNVPSAGTIVQIQ